MKNLGKTWVLFFINLPFFERLYSDFMETVEQEEELLPYYLRDKFKRRVSNSRIKQRALSHFLKRVHQDNLINDEDHTSLKRMIDSTSKEDRYIAQQILNFKIYGGGDK